MEVFVNVMNLRQINAYSLKPLTHRACQNGTRPDAIEDFSAPTKSVRKDNSYDANRCSLLLLFEG